MGHVMQSSFGWLTTTPMYDHRGARNLPYCHTQYGSMAGSPNMAPYFAILPYKVWQCARLCVRHDIFVHYYTVSCRRRLLKLDFLQRRKRRVEDMSRSCHIFICNFLF